MSTTPISQVGAQDAPIACTLSSSAYRTRTRDLSKLARRALTAREQIDGGERLTFVDIPEVARAVAAAVALEATCCPFLTMKLDRGDQGLVLDVTGPADARPMIAELFV